jgi:hypothetical protein
MATPKDPPRLEDAFKPGDKELAAEAGGDASVIESFEPPVSAAEREAAEKRLAKAARGGAKSVRVINMKMGTTTILVPTGGGVTRVKIPAFGVSPELPLEYAKRLFRQISDRKHENKRPTLAFEPEARPADAAPESFTDRSSGMIFTTDSYAPPSGLKNPAGGTYRHSIRQAQLFVAALRTPEAIKRYIREFDNRQAVMAYAQQVMTHRQAQELKHLGSEAAASDAMV